MKSLPSWLVTITQTSVREILAGLALIVSGGLKLMLIACLAGGVYMTAYVSYRSIKLVLVELPARRADITHRQAMVWSDYGVTVQGLGYDVKPSITNTSSKPFVVEVRCRFDGVVNNDADLMWKQTIAPNQTVDPGFLCEEYFIVVLDDVGKEVGRIMLA